MLANLAWRPGRDRPIAHDKSLLFCQGQHIRRGNSIRLSGADAELLTPEQIREKWPFFNFDDERFPIKGALWQPRGGTVRHDAVAWGYARAASDLGVDIIQNCEVTSFDIHNGTCRGVETTRGAIKAKKVEKRDEPQ